MSRGRGNKHMRSNTTMAHPGPYGLRSDSARPIQGLSVLEGWALEYPHPLPSPAGKSAGEGDLFRLLNLVVNHLSRSVSRCSAAWDSPLPQGTQWDRGAGVRTSTGQADSPAGN